MLRNSIAMIVGFLSLLFHVRASGNGPVGLNNLYQSDLASGGQVVLNLNHKNLANAEATRAIQYKELRAAKETEERAIQAERNAQDAYQKAQMNESNTGDHATTQNALVEYNSKKAEREVREKERKEAQGKYDKAAEQVRQARGNTADAWKRSRLMKEQAENNKGPASSDQAAQKPSLQDQKSDLQSKLDKIPGEEQYSSSEANELRKQISDIDKQLVDTKTPYDKAYDKAISKGKGAEDANAIAQGQLADLSNTPEPAGPPTPSSPNNSTTPPTPSAPNETPTAPGSQTGSDSRRPNDPSKESLNPNNWFSDGQGTEYNPVTNEPSRSVNDLSQSPQISKIDSASLSKSSVPDAGYKNIGSGENAGQLFKDKHTGTDFLGSRGYDKLPEGDAKGSDLTWIRRNADGSTSLIPGEKVPTDGTSRFNFPESRSVQDLGNGKQLVAERGNTWISDDKGVRFEPYTKTDYNLAGGRSYDGGGFKVTDNSSYSWTQKPGTSGIDPSHWTQVTGGANRTYNGLDPATTKYIKGDGNYPWEVWSRVYGGNIGSRSITSPTASGVPGNAL